MFSLLRVVIAYCCLLPVVLGVGVCDSYEARCALQLGVPLDQEFTSLTGQNLYFQVTVKLTFILVLLP